ncbi:MAG: ATP-binding protein [Proteobacteria bacterium]|nr:ATP-binding protein [Pseudomonadota bacterium]
MDLLHELIGDALPDDTGDLASPDLARIEASELQALYQPFPACDLVDAVATEAAPLIERNHNQLVVHCPSNIGAIESDKEKLRLVLLKLLENAALNTDAGRIDLVVSRVDRDGVMYLNFSIRDTGAGMSRDHLDKLFHLGDGLELAIARCFCLIMGGDLAVESTPGVGTIFDVQLPLHPPSVLLDEPPVPAVTRAWPLARASFHRI